MPGKARPLVARCWDVEQRYTEVEFECSTPMQVAVMLARLGYPRVLVVDPAEGNTVVSAVEPSRHGPKWPQIVVYGLDQHVQSPLPLGAPA